MKDNKELVKLIKENPKLPLVFFVNNDERCSDYGSTVYEDYYVKVREIYILDEEWSDDFDYVVEVYSDRFCDHDKYKDLTKEEFEIEMKKYVNENIEHYKAMVLYVG